MAYRLKGRYGYPADDPFRVTFHPDRLDQPLKWKKPKRIFVCSMGDLFHKNVKSIWIYDILATMYNAQQHIYLVLTKRPEILLKDHEPWIEYDWGGWPQCTWLGVTAENQARADERIPILLQIPAAQHFVSIEPMLGPVDISSYLPIITIGGVEMERWPGWVIVGGETGPGARLMDPDWARSIRDQCREAEVPFFMKQMSNKQPIPEDLKIREYPT